MEHSLKTDLNELVIEDSAARLIDVFVDELNFTLLGFNGGRRAEKNNKRLLYF
jgi:hypothetical protein